MNRNIYVEFVALATAGVPDELQQWFDAHPNISVDAIMNNGNNFYIVFHYLHD